MTAGPRIADHMVREVVTLDPTEEINRAVSILLDKGISRARRSSTRRAGWLVSCR